MNATCIRIKFAGLGAAQFDEIEAAVGAREDEPEGLIFHSSGPVDDGWSVLDYWETRTQFDSFIAERVLPALDEVGITAQPEITEYRVHEYFVAEAARELAIA